MGESVQITSQSRLVLTLAATSNNAIPTRVQYSGRL